MVRQMPVLRFDLQPKRALYDLQADPTRRPLFDAIKSVLVRLRDGDDDPPVWARAFQVAGGGHGYYTTIRRGHDSWAVLWKRLEDGSLGILYIGPDNL